jgi:Poly(ADP-ribose) polymerase and DNA-Ligase Zn-finger region
LKKLDHGAVLAPRAVLGSRPGDVARATLYPSSVSHLFEPAASGRSKCHGCAQPIPRGELRFGERLPNPFGQGEMTLWFHPACAAYKRPEPLLQALGETLEKVPDRESLERAARSSLAHRRLPRIDGAEHAPSGQASCRQPIARGSWRIRLVFYEEGRFSPGGFVHVDCRKAYFETNDVLDRVLHFSAGLSDAERGELRRTCS